MPPPPGPAGGTQSRPGPEKKGGPAQRGTNDGPGPIKEKQGGPGQKKGRARPEKKGRARPGNNGRAQGRKERTDPRQQLVVQEPPDVQKHKNIYMYI